MPATTSYRRKTHICCHCPVPQKRGGKAHRLPPLHIYRSKRLLRLVILFQPAVEPTEEGAMPQQSVLGLQYPVVLVGIDKQLGGYATQFGCIESTHTLRCKYAVVFLAMYAEDGGIPLVDKAVGRVGKGALCRSICFIPRCAAHIPIGKPHLLGLHILLLDVEDTGMGYKGIETVVVMTGQPIYRETAVAGAYGTHLAYIGLFLQGIGSRKIVEHVLAAIVAADLFEPLLTETG